MIVQEWVDIRDPRWLGRRLAQLRVMQRLTQQQLGALLVPQLTQSELSRWELGKASVRGERLPELAAALGVPLIAFLVGVIEPDVPRGGDEEDWRVDSEWTAVLGRIPVAHRAWWLAYLRTAYPATRPRGAPLLQSQP